MTETIGVVCLAPANDASGNKHCWKFGSRPLLEFLVRRLTDCQQLDQVLVVAGPEFEDGRLADVVPPDVSVHFTDQPDLLGRLLSVAEASGASGLVTIDAEHPFIDPILVDRLVTTSQAHPECDYLGFCFRDGRPVVRSPLGAFADWYRVGALRQANRLALKPEERNDVSRLVRSRPERFTLRFLPVPPPLESDKLKLSVGDHEAWEYAQTIYDCLGPEGLNWRTIADVLSG
ncbi:MAG TPA: NTP transferase domain-containing protein [Pirellulales bacterium]|nr:NTP transferase domain-containing protein [Pirellulales bacterium]